MYWGWNFCKQTVFWAGLLLNGRVLAYITQDSELQRKEPVWKSMSLAIHNPKNRKELYKPVG